MNGYIQIHVGSDGFSLDCWQRIVEGNVVAIVDGADLSVALPDPYCSYCITGEMLASLPA